MARRSIPLLKDVGPVAAFHSPYRMLVPRSPCDVGPVPSEFHSRIGLALTEKGAAAEVAPQTAGAAEVAAALR